MSLSDRNADIPTSADSVDNISTIAFVLDKAPSDPQSGDKAQQQYFGRYRVEKLLGKGGFGEVYQAWDDDLRRAVAIKVTFRGRLNDSSKDSYLAEARLVATLDHPSIIPVYDIGSTLQGDYYVVSKLIDGSDLATRINSSPISREDAIVIVATIADALNYAHSKGLVHRDIKPANILIDLSDRAYLADFGIALSEEDIGKDLSNAGTPAYMSPEQARGEGHRVDNRSDIYSLGVVLYELLTGRRPFRATKPRELLSLIASEDVRSPRVFDGTVPIELERICLKAVARRAVDRYPVARDFAADLRTYLNSLQQPSSRFVPPLTESDSQSTPNSLHDSRRGLAETELDTVVPKGLRSFDSNDASFFLQLIPGPYHRDGLPECLHFWRSRIEQSDESTFRVGLVYGPSGCGKSSLMKAGLIPTLPQNIITVYLEATNNDTEQRLAKAIHKRFPDAEGKELADLLASIRRRKLVPTAGKLLIIIDQIEQWLHTNPDYSKSPLCDALRQCDGIQIQTIVMVRDDYWLSVSRFLREIEVPIVEGQNSLLVDLFDIAHATKVLGLFGQAYGKLPKSMQAWTSEHTEFLNTSVRELAQNRKVICVRLAVFAEMMKNRDWTPHTLREVGGIDGIGVTFLDETFASNHMAPALRPHRSAVEALLKALLPSLGIDIKGHSRTVHELMQSTGYLSKPAEFLELIQIMDRNLRLITSIDAAKQDSETQSNSTSDSLTTSTSFNTIDSSTQYQLTHDYLVPSIREWLNRNQLSSRKGRAELLLTERANAWIQRKESKQLPTFLEWLSICLLTQRSQRSLNQQKMMQSANRFHLARIGLTIAAAIVTLISIQATMAFYESRQQAADIRLLVEGLGKAEKSEVVTFVEKLKPYEQRSISLLKQVFAESQEGSNEQDNTAIALLALSPSDSIDAQNTLLANCLTASPSDLVHYAKIFETSGLESSKLMSAKVEDNSLDPTARMHAAVLLARLQPKATIWQQRDFCNFVAVQLSQGTALQIASWQQLLVSVKDEIVPDLTQIITNPDFSETQRLQALAIVCDYLENDPEKLTELAAITPAAYLSVTIEKLRPHREKAIELLTSILDRKPAIYHPIELLTPDTQLSDHAVAILTKHRGLYTDRFAMCALMPEEDFLEFDQHAKKSGYQLVRLRPRNLEEKLHFSIVYHKIHNEVRWKSNMSASQLKEINREMHHAGLEFSDLSAYSVVDAGTETRRYAAVWYKPSVSSDVPHEPMEDQLIDQTYVLDIPSEQVNAAVDEIYQNFWPVSFTASYESPSKLLYCIAGNRQISNTKWNWSWITFFDSENAYTNDVYLDRVQRDLVVETLPSDQLNSAAEEHTSPEIRELIQLSLVPSAPEILRFEKNNLEELKPDQLYTLAIGYLSQSETSKARAIIDKARQRGINGLKKRAFEAAWLMMTNKHAEALEELLDDTLLNDANVDDLIVLGKVFCLASKRDSSSELQTQQLLSKALQCLTSASAIEPLPLYSLAESKDFAPLHDLAEYRLLFGSFPRTYNKIEEHDLLSESRTLLTLNSDKHQIEARGLMELGYFPTSISVTGNAALTQISSVWNKPISSDGQLDELAQQKANAAAILIQFGEEQSVMELFQNKEDPREASWLIHTLPLARTPAKRVWDILADTKDDLIKHHLLLALGEYKLSDFATDLQPAVLEWLQEQFRSAENAAVHGAAEWVLREFGQQEWIDQTKIQIASDFKRQSDKLEAIAKQLQSTTYDQIPKWYLTPEAHTMLIIPGPNSFTMGTGAISAVNVDGDYFVENQQKCFIRHSFAVSKTLVTCDQISKFTVKPRGSFSERRQPDLPAVRVNWRLAAEYCNWLSGLEGLPESEFCYRFDGEHLVPKENYLDLAGYRLPTEIELEFAIRGGATTARPYGFADSLFDEYGWSIAAADGMNWPVAMKKPNRFGLSDPLGNILSWCQNTPTSGRFNQPLKPEDLGVPQSDENVLVMLAGSTINPNLPIYCGTRCYHISDQQLVNFGFRVARTINGNAKFHLENMNSPEYTLKKKIQKPWFGVMVTSDFVTRVALKPSVLKESNTPNLQFVLIDGEGRITEVEDLTNSSNLLAFFEPNLKLTYELLTFDDHRKMSGIAFGDVGAPAIKFIEGSQTEHDKPTKVWRGSLPYQNREVQIRIYKDLFGSPYVLLDSLSEGVSGAISDLRLEQNDWELTNSFFKVNIKGKLSDDGTSVDATFSQGNLKLPFKLLLQEP